MTVALGARGGIGVDTREDAAPNALDDQGRGTLDGAAVGTKVNVRGGKSFGRRDGAFVSALIRYASNADGEEEVDARVKDALNARNDMDGRKIEGSAVGKVGKHDINSVGELTDAADSPACGADINAQVEGACHARSAEGNKTIMRAAVGAAGARGGPWVDGVGACKALLLMYWATRGATGAARLIA